LCNALLRGLGCCYDDCSSAGGGGVVSRASVVRSVVGASNLAEEICAPLGYYAASSGNPLPTFRDNISLPSSRIKKSNKKRAEACPARQVTLSDSLVSCAEQLYVSAGGLWSAL
jgi:hypothetical protein